MIQLRFTSLGSIAMGGVALLALLTAPQRADAGPWGGSVPQGTRTYDYDPRAYAPSVTQNPYGYGDGYGGGYGQRPRAGRIPVDPAQLQSELAQRCNVGRLVGGIVGGGLGYAVSREDGRSWAVPLGALLGQQMGCSIGAGRDPLPW